MASQDHLDIGNSNQKPKNILEIIFKLVLVSLGFAVFYVQRIYREYTEVRFSFDQNNFVSGPLQQTPVISIGDTTGPLNEVYFPSVTVCNLNQVEYKQRV